MFLFIAPPAPTEGIILDQHIYIVALILLVFSVFIILHSPPPDLHTRVIELYGSELRDKYIETLTNQMNLEYPTPGQASVSANSIKTTQLLLSPKDLILYEGIMKIQIEDILKPVSEERLRFVLIEGEPGIGKSTLAKELVLRWANRSDELMNNYDIAFLIQLRFEMYHNATSIEDLFVDLDDQSIDMSVLKLEITKRKGAGILWILDGFDKLPNHLKHSSVIMKLMKGDILPNSIVIVTSTPTASDQLLNFFDHNSKRISIRGIDSTKVQEYASKYFNNNKEVLTKFHSYYNGNLVIESMLYNPLNCFIVCTIFNDFIATNNEQYPKTMTSLYNHYVRIILKRHLIDTGLISCLNYKMPQRLMLATDFNNPLLQSVWKNFSLLSKIAYDGVMNQQYIFGKELHNVTKLSMMDTITNYFSFRKDESSSFLHTTLQEYFAAVYLVNNKPKFTIKNNELDLHPNLKVVLTFYVGICKMTGSELDSTVLDILKHNMTVSTNDKKIYIGSILLGCLYEDDSLIYNTMIGLPVNHSLYSYSASSPRTNSNYYILGYLVAVHNITYNGLFLNSDQIKAFTKGLQSHSLIRGKVDLSFGFLIGENRQRAFKELLLMPSHSVSGIKIFLSNNLEICQIISRFHTLQTFTFYIDNLQWSCNEAPENPLLKLKKLKKLEISIDYLLENELVTLKQLIAPGRPLKILYLVNYGTPYNNILNLIEKQTSLEELTIRDNADIHKHGTETFSSVWNLKLPEYQRIIWTKSTNNLMVDYFENFFYNIKMRTLDLPTIQLSSFTSFTYIMTRKTNVTVYSKSRTLELNHFIDAFGECLKMLPVKDRIDKIILNNNFTCKCVIVKHDELHH